MRLCQMMCFCAFLRVLRVLGVSVHFSTKMGCKKQICTEFCKNVQKALLCCTPLSHTPFCVSPSLSITMLQSQHEMAFPSFRNRKLICSISVSQQTYKEDQCNRSPQKKIAASIFYQENRGFAKGVGTKRVSLICSDLF